MTKRELAAMRRYVEAHARRGADTVDEPSLRR